MNLLVDKLNLTPLPPILLLLVGRVSLSPTASPQFDIVSAPVFYSHTL
jgi:hypothetical protein